jgi:hypothetical protein
MTDDELPGHGTMSLTALPTLAGKDLAMDNGIMH